MLFVSGASSDIGMALVGLVAPLYDTVLCHYSSPDSVRRFDSIAAQLPGKITPLQADFSDEQSTQALIERISRDGFHPEHFVHLAASSESINVRFRKTSWQLFEREINVALRSSVILTQAFLPAMVKAGHGKIVFMLSSATIWEPAKAFAASYTTVKYALLGLMKSLAAEYAADGVTVNSVSPSMVDTKFIRMPDIVRQTNIEAAPRKRLLAVNDVIPLIEFLLSSGADNITGQNCGITAGC